MPVVLAAISQRIISLIDNITKAGTSKISSL